MTGFVLILPILFPPERDKVSCQNSFQPPGTPKHTDGIRNWKLGIEEPTARHPAGAGDEKSQILCKAQIPPASPFGNLSRSYGMTGFVFILPILFPPERDKVSCQNLLATGNTERNWELGIGKQEYLSRHPAGAGQVFEESRLGGR